ncbi:hypothetical protein V1514DRAFT_124905 [Lipomyces japonicus]|uniref:uncharacterized protein n=1 Tax=Lipomyces japonicus TaxID=56871 RepID=UPI0034CD9825
MGHRPASTSRNRQARSRIDKKPRSRLGCLTCRARHKRCDQRAPTCMNCERLKIPCQGYASILRWQDRLMQTAEVASTSYRSVRYVNLQVSDYERYGGEIDALLDIYSPYDVLDDDDDNDDGGSSCLSMSLSVSSSDIATPQSGGVPSSQQSFTVLTPLPSPPELNINDKFSQVSHECDDMTMSPSHSSRGSSGLLTPLSMQGNFKSSLPDITTANFVLGSATTPMFDQLNDTPSIAIPTSPSLPPPPSSSLQPLVTTSGSTSMTTKPATTSMFEITQYDSFQPGSISFIENNNNWNMIGNETFTDLSMMAMLPSFIPSFVDVSYVNF